MSFLFLDRFQADIHTGLETAKYWGAKVLDRRKMRYSYKGCIVEYHCGDWLVTDSNGCCTVFCTLDGAFDELG